MNRHSLSGNLHDQSWFRDLAASNFHLWVRGQPYFVFVEVIDLLVKTNKGFEQRNCHADVKIIAIPSEVAMRHRFDFKN